MRVPGVSVPVVRMPMPLRMHVIVLVMLVRRAARAILPVAVAMTLSSHLPLLYPRSRPPHDHPLCYWAV